MQRTAKKWNLLKHVQLSAEMIEAIWNEDEGRWKLKVRTADGQIRDDYADVFVNCAGFLKCVPLSLWRGTG